MSEAAVPREADRKEEAELSLELASALRRRSRRERIRKVFWPSLVLVLGLLLWEVTSRLEIVNPIILPPPGEVVEAWGRLMTQAFFWEAVQVTMTETLVGFAIGSGVGFVLGVLTAIVSTMRFAIYPYVVAFQNTPRVAFAPLLVTWFGFGLESKIALAAAICFFPILINVFVGISTVDEDARTVMKSYGASRWQMFRKLSLPYSLPFTFAGLKTGMSLALIGAVVGEFVGGARGMGVLIDRFNYLLRVADAFAVLATLALIGTVLYGIMEFLDRRIVFWIDR